MPRSLGESTIKGWADKIATEYVKNGGPISDEAQVLRKAAVLKTASTEGLNPEQLKRLTEANNISVYTALMADRQPGEDVRFPRLDPKEMVQQFNGPELITEEQPADYQAMPPKAAMDITGMSAIPHVRRDIDAEMEKQASAKPGDDLTVKDCIDLIGKFETAKEECQAKAASLDLALKVEVTKLGEITRQYLMDGQDIDTIVKMAITARPDDQPLIAEAFGHVISKLAYKGHIPIQGQFKFGSALPPEWISSRLKEMSPGVDVEVINGSNPIIKSIDTLSHNWNERKRCEDGASLSEGELKKLRKVLVDIGGMGSSKERVGNQNSGANK